GLLAVWTRSCRRGSGIRRNASALSTIPLDNHEWKGLAEDPGRRRFGARHARASLAEVAVEASSGLVAVVRDDGAGLGGADPWRGLSSLAGRRRHPGRK